MRLSQLPFLVLPPGLAWLSLFSCAGLVWEWGLRHFRPCLMCRSQTPAFCTCLPCKHQIHPHQVLTCLMLNIAHQLGTTSLYLAGGNSKLCTLEGLTTAQCSTDGCGAARVCLWRMLLHSLALPKVPTTSPCSSRFMADADGVCRAAHGAGAAPCSQCLHCHVAHISLHQKPTTISHAMLSPILMPPDL